MSDPTDSLRPPWSRSERRIPRGLVRPLQEFLRTSTSSVVPLLIAIAAALVWANSPRWRSYEALWQTHVSIGIGGWVIDETLRFWVEEGLMTFFFLLAGLEIKRELVSGELRDRRAAILPIAGAIGGMIVPAVIYLAITRGSDAAPGWGMAMPTDLALALGIVVLAVRTAPPGLRPFLLSLAIVDDLLTVVVVALFYAGDLSALPLMLGVACLAAMVLADRLHVRALAVYLVLGAGVWVFAYEGGFHPALVGAILGLLAPAVPFQRPIHVSAAAHEIADRTSDEPTTPDEDAASWLELAELSREAVSPLARIERALLPWVSIGVLPLFALANAGVRLSGGWWSDATAQLLIVGLVLARSVGKIAGVTAACLLVARLVKIRDAPSSRVLLGVGAAAAAPFTVSLFVASTTFPQGSSLLGAARVGVLVSLAVSGVVAVVVLRRQLSERPHGEEP